MYFAASYAVHIFPQIEVNELLISLYFIQQDELPWPSSCSQLHGYSTFPCCLWQPGGVPQSQMWNLAALAPCALRSIPWAWGPCVSRGTGTWRLSLLCCTCTSPRARQRQRVPTELLHTPGNQLDGSAQMSAEALLHPGPNCSVLPALITERTRIAFPFTKMFVSYIDDQKEEIPLKYIS